MHKAPAFSRHNESGSTLILVLVLTAAMSLTLLAVLGLGSSHTRFTGRQSQLHATSAAAEAATEKVISAMMSDFKDGLDPADKSNVKDYAGIIPSSKDDGVYWADWEFNNGNKKKDRVSVIVDAPSTYTNLDSVYSGLRGFAASYSVIANARQRSAQYDISAGVRQQFQLAMIPVFQFAMFYGVPMEIGCGQPFTIKGRVHCNSDIYVEPISDLTFASHVTAAGDILFERHPLDTRSPPTGTVTYLGEKASRVGRLNLPIGTNNTPEAVRAILAPPPNSEKADSAMGRQRYFNKAQMIITVGNGTVSASSGLFDNFKTSVPSNQLGMFIKTNASFWDAREAKRVRPVDLDVGMFRSWSLTNSNLRIALSGLAPNSIYVLDLRTLPGTSLAAVRVLNGAQLPPNGLTVATAFPLYVWGNYNQPSAGFLGTTNTTTTSPASLVADAITVLSAGWTDALSSNSVSARVAVSTTVNAAFLCGIVETPSFNSYSGGAENFPRFLETWGSSRIFTYNGSMVAMFASRYATKPWGSSDVYSPPVRNWSFDQNFTEAGRLPPGTPNMAAMVRGSWDLVQPNTTNAVARGY